MHFFVCFCCKLVEKCFFFRSVRRARCNRFVTLPDNDDYSQQEKSNRQKAKEGVKRPIKLFLHVHDRAKVNEPLI